jgi:hypothetical protein
VSNRMKWFYYLRVSMAFMAFYVFKYGVRKECIRLILNQCIDIIIKQIVDDITYDIDNNYNCKFFNSKLIIM